MYVDRHDHRSRNRYAITTPPDSPRNVDPCPGKTVRIESAIASARCVQPRRDEVPSHDHASASHDRASARPAAVPAGLRPGRGDERIDRDVRPTDGIDEAGNFTNGIN